MELNLNRFLAIYGNLISMPETLMGSNHCSIRILQVYDAHMLMCHYLCIEVC
jgi:hypothetical protein